jgi:Uma2 family endonuclease
MNTHFRPPEMTQTTQAAEGLQRRRWSLAEVEAMVEAGILLEDDRFELIGGEVVPMSPKGNRHELIKAALNRYWTKRLLDGVCLITETTLRVGGDTFHEPDFVFYREADGLAKLRPSTVLIAVEIADTSLHFDLHRKVPLYAGYGIRETWIIDASTLETHVNRHPGSGGYGEVFVNPASREIAPLFAAELAVRLSDLKLV